MVIGPEALEWDMALMVEYPSRAKFLEMAGNPDYLAVHAHRAAALVDSRLIACRALSRARLDPAPGPPDLRLKAPAGGPRGRRLGGRPRSGPQLLWAPAAAPASPPSSSAVIYGESPDAVRRDSLHERIGCRHRHARAARRLGGGRGTLEDRVLRCATSRSPRSTGASTRSPGRSVATQRESSRSTGRSMWPASTPATPDAMRVFEPGLLRRRAPSHDRDRRRDRRARGRRTDPRGEWHPDRPRGITAGGAAASIHRHRRPPRTEMSFAYGPAARSAAATSAWRGTRRSRPEGS